ncbi:MAG: TetR family transcriptional regulator [Nevskia sp.]|nr:TetR family transcriptional regulator [Nevskia sp.]
MATSIAAGRSNVAVGKQKLIDAALRLGARGTGLDGIGLRELAREAGLNPTTFYCHFDSMEHLAQTVAEAAAAQIMAGIQDVRAHVAKHADVTRCSVEFFLDFVVKQPDVFRVGLRELHGGSPAIRAILRRVLDQIAEESVEQIEHFDLMPGADRALLRQATGGVTYYMFYRALDCAERPQLRAALADEMVQYIRMVFTGSRALATVVSG